MTPTTLGELDIGSGVRIGSNASDADYRVLDHVLIHSTDAVAPNLFGLSVQTDRAAIELLASHHDLQVDGSVLGYVGVRLGDDPGVDFNNDLTITSGGTVTGTHTGAHLLGSGTMSNAGVLRGGLVGATVELVVNGTHTASNTGLIQGALHGYVVEGPEMTQVLLTNDGIIKGKYFSYIGVSGHDEVRNTGTMSGDVALGSGDDLFVNVGGVVQGTIEGGGGHDMFALGASVETVNGENGWDTADYRASSGVTVSLAGGAGTGWAAGDILLNVERAYGSNTGSDTLIGGGIANILSGFGGADSLNGAGGHDKLLGGNGIDTISGGLGNDVFVLAGTSAGRDLITDFHNVSGDDDLFHIAAASLGAGMAKGALDAGLFRARGDNQAQDIDDRIIFRTTDKTLWLDKDGSGVGAAILIADLQAGATITTLDILLV